TPPSSFLTPLSRLRAASTEDVASALAHLRHLYWPESAAKAPLPPHFTIPVRHIQKSIHDMTVPDSGYASGTEDEGAMEDEVLLDDDDDALEALRADTFERAFVIRWLTGLIARADAWAGTIDEEDRLDVIDDASSLLSAFTCSEEEAEVAVTRELAFPAPDGISVRVELNDAPLSTSDHTSVGLQSWASSIVLAERMCANPSQFGVSTSSPRILELGAGTGLLSIVAAKLAPASVIVATDYHPDVLANCAANVATNASGSAPIAVERLDWQSPEYAGALAAPFDVVLAADVIYHPEHACWIKGCVERTLRPGGLFWLMIPVRATGRHEGMYRTVEEVFAPGASRLTILEDEHITRRDGVGRADEVGYRLYKIGWTGTH
ncbi:S-adenosyl-L-methionine-dependent methyltransferase, partial [Schizophyllum fasciatum]